MAADSSALALNSLTGSFLGFAVLSVATRFYARRVLKGALGPDDWLMLCAGICYLGLAICIFLSTSSKDLGYSSGTSASLGPVAEGEKLGIAIDCLLTACLGCSKASALFFYKRLFCVKGRQTVFNIIVISMIVVVACWSITMIFLACFQCGIHLAALWDGDYVKYCTISFAYILGFGISGFLLDIIILSLPIPIICRLHATLSRKLTIIGIFLLASVGLAGAIVRMVGYIRLEFGGQTYLETHNQELLISRAYFYSVLEAGISIVAINLPSIWFLCVHSAPEALLRSVRSVMSLGSRDSKGSNGSNGTNGTKPTNGVSGKSSDGSYINTQNARATQVTTVPGDETNDISMKDLSERSKHEDV